MHLQLLTLLGLLLVPLSLPLPHPRLEGPTTTPFYQECIRNSDCPEDHCCVLGMMRYQKPHCQRLGFANDPCHPYPDAYRSESNLTLYFPNKQRLELDEALARNICPCHGGFQCSKETGTCLTRQ